MRPIVLSGFMATGKSTVGPAVAASLGAPFVDTDDEVAREAGRSVPELWVAEGEAAFRAREAKVVERLLASPEPRVIAFGGGTVTVAGAVDMSARNARIRPGGRQRGVSAALAAGGTLEP